MSDEIKDGPTADADSDHGGVGPDDEASYGAYVDYCAAQCMCCPDCPDCQDVPCDGLLAGGWCDQLCCCDDYDDL